MGLGILWKLYDRRQALFRKYIISEEKRTALHFNEDCQKKIDKVIGNVAELYFLYILLLFYLLTCLDIVYVSAAVAAAPSFTYSCTGSAMTFQDTSACILMMEASFANHWHNSSPGLIAG